MRIVGYTLLACVALAVLAWLLLTAEHQTGWRASQPTSPSANSANAIVDEGRTVPEEIKSRSSLIEEESNAQPVPHENADDRMLNAWTVLDYCDDPSFPKKTSVQNMIAYEKKQHGEASAVARTTEILLKNLCSQDRIQPSTAEPIGDYLGYFYDTSKSFQETAAFFELLMSGDTSAIDRDQVHNFVRDKIKSTQSAYEFLATMQVFNETPAVYQSLKDFGYPPNIQQDTANYVAIAASCRIFGGCSAYSAYSVKLCFLICDRPMGADEFARWSVPEREMDRFNHAVDAIVAARR